MKRIFVTGGTGFFGKSLLAAHRGERELVVLSRDPAAFLRRNPEFAGLPGVTFVSGDVRSFGFPAGRFDAVLHAATPVDPELERDRPEEVRSIVLDGTRRVLAFCRERKIPRLLYTGSGAVYGPQEPECECMEEEHPCRPVTVYGRAKLEAEQLCLNSGIPTAIARCFAFVGPYLALDAHFAAGNFLRDVLENRPIEVRGDGRPLRSYLDASDLVRWLWTLLESGTPGRVYNVGSDEAVSIAELARLCAELRTPALPVRVAEPSGAGPAPRYLPDVSRAKIELGLIPSVDLASALRNAFEFHRKRGIL